MKNKNTGKEVAKKENGITTKGELLVLEGKLPTGVTKEEVQGLLQTDLKRTIDGVIPRLPQIKILHAGALRFEIPGEEVGKTKQVEDFEGIIIDQHPCNAFWEQSFAESGGGVLPACSSLNGKVGSEHGDCLSCSRNQFGSGLNDAGESTAGKACKNMKRLHILLDGHELPYRLTLPPTSIKEADTFFCALVDRQIPMTTIRVRFSLADAQSSQKIHYSRIEFSAVGQIEIEKYMEIQKFLKDHLTQIRGQEIRPDEYESKDPMDFDPEKME